MVELGLVLAPGAGPGVEQPADPVAPAAKVLGLVPVRAVVAVRRGAVDLTASWQLKLVAQGSQPCLAG